MGLRERLCNEAIDLNRRIGEKKLEVDGANIRLRISPEIHGIEVECRSLYAKITDILDGREVEKISDVVTLDNIVRCLKEIHQRYDRILSILDSLSAFSEN